jgi:hypothetical protein
MKKIFKAAVIMLAMAVSGTGAWASTEHPLTQLSQAQIDQYKADKHRARHRHDKAHNVAGSAVRGASQVSPKPVGDH